MASCRRFDSCLRLHSNGPIHAHHFSVHHGIQNDGLDHHGVLVGLSQTLREGHRLSQMSLHLLWKRLEERCFEKSGSNGAHADTLIVIKQFYKLIFGLEKKEKYKNLRSQISSNRESHSDDSSFRGGISGLTHLSIVSSHRRRVDNDTALTIFIGRVLSHQTGRQSNDVEGADRVDHQDFGKVFQLVRQALVEVVGLESNADS